MSAAEPLLLLLALAQALLGARVLARFATTAGGDRIRASDEPGGGSVSVVLPVLDEEARLGPCLEALVAQPREVAEILVVDGGSRDRTREVALGFSARDDRVHFVDAFPVPGSWTGKAWGLETGLRRASGDWLLCVDADVRVRPALTRSLLAHAARTGVRAFSVATRQRLSGALQALLHPSLLATLVYRFGGPGHATRDPGRAQGNGQCFLAPRARLVETGAFAAARRSLCEDVTIVRHLAACGEPVALYEAGDLVEVTMYESWRETWRNWPRSLPMRDAFFGPRQALGLVEVAAVQALPLPLLLAALALGAPPWLLALEGVLASSRIGVLVGTARAYPRRPLAYWLSPLADLPVATRLAHCALQRRHVWRGRAYVRGPDGGFRPEGGHEPDAGFPSEGGFQRQGGAR